MFLIMEKMSFIVLTLIGYIGLIVFILISIAFSTLIERKVMASMQRRLGPNVVGFMGLLQPLADGLKLFVKELLLPQKANHFLFIAAPVLVLFVSLYLWIFLPLNLLAYTNLTFTLFYILVISVLESYGIIFAGWASNSKYALLGGLRSTSQMISYEISLSFVFLSVLVLGGTLNFIELIHWQNLMQNPLFFALLPMAIIFLISMLAEVNRAPFDLPEAEAEIVAGYNVEYSGMLFTYFFLGEYSNMIFLSAIFCLLFLGGGFFPLILIFSFSWYVIFALKICFLFFIFVWLRATLPRYRYDQLMDLGWKIFLPFTFGFFIFLVLFLYFFNSFPQF